MTFDELRKTWQEQNKSSEIKVDSDMLLKEVQRNKDHFESMIFWRDVREVGAGIFVAGWVGYSAISSKTWSLIPLAFAGLFIAVSMTIDRIIQKKKRPAFGDKLSGCVESSLHQVTHQIRLLRNVFWWYLLPILIGVTIFTFHLAWMWRDNSALFWPHILKSTAIWAFLTWGIYKLNQYAVRKYLQPRRQELEELLGCLVNDNKQQ